MDFRDADTNRGWFILSVKKNRRIGTYHSPTWIESRVQGYEAAKRPAVGALNKESAVWGLVLRFAQPELAGFICREKPEAE